MVLRITLVTEIRDGTPESQERMKDLLWKNPEEAVNWLVEQWAGGWAKFKPEIVVVQEN